MVTNQKLRDFYFGQDRPNTFEELVSFLSDISGRHVHGVRDNDHWEKGRLVRDKSTERLERIQRGPDELVCHCRYIGQTTLKLLRDVGIEGRMVEFAAAEREYNDFRHNVTEVKYDGRWIHADTDLGVMFRSPEGYFTSLKVVESLQEGSIQSTNLARINPRIRIDEAVYPYFRAMIEKDENLLNFYRNVTASIMIGTDFYTPNPTLGEAVRANFVDSKRAEAQLLTREEFVKMYY